MIAAISTAKTAISNFVASPESTVYSLIVLCDRFFGIFSSSHFFLADATEVGVSDDRDDAAILHRERDSYRTNVLHVCELNFLL